MAQAINWKQLREQYESTEEYRTQVIIFWNTESYFKESLRKCRIVFLNSAVCTDIDRQNKLTNTVSSGTDAYINCVLCLSKLNPTYYK
jgi:hypothetical protein